MITKAKYYREVKNTKKYWIWKLGTQCVQGCETEANFTRRAVYEQVVKQTG